MNDLYCQPSFYKFNSDSILLSHGVANFMAASSLKQFQIIDLGAGCGVVALEAVRTFYSKCQDFRNTSIQIDFVEIQSEFLPYLQENTQELIQEYPNVKFTIHHRKFSELKKIDIKNKDNLCLIVCGNLPYFAKNQGKLSNNINRRICRHFIHDSLEDIKEWLTLIKANKVFLLAGREFSVI
jgi:tRNA1(Val) A37 N6-methylase TrmN6